MFELFRKKELSKDEVATLLQTDINALEKFEEAYQKKSLETGISDNFFKINAKQMAEEKRGIVCEQPDLSEAIHKIVKGLISQTTLYEYNRSKQYYSPFNQNKEIGEDDITNEYISQLSEEIRPELTSNLMKKDTSGNSYEILLMTYQMYLKEKNPAKRKMLYGSFRQGLDILDLDCILYEMLGMNPASMGHWLCKMSRPVEEEGFFKIPNTKIIKVPMTLLQLTRLEYMNHTRTTLDIVNEYCKQVFGLSTDKEYFVKTGTYSSKYDFRNAKVAGTEVNELGEYLLFIHSQAIRMADYDLTGRNQPIIYGVSTTNEWVVREFISDKENNPTIYHGLPLHTEYRVFVDFDTDEVLGIHPYWDPNVMKKHFDGKSDIDSIHDAITFRAAESKLMKRYNEHKEEVVTHIEKLLPDVKMSGQWSIDIMQNGEEFWFIDMAPAESSAFYKETVPPTLRKHMEENWLPKIE